MKVSQLYNFGSFVLNLGELQYLLLVLVLVLVLALVYAPCTLEWGKAGFLNPHI